jgi:hypothetical protein
MKTNYKAIGITAIGIMGLVPAMSYTYNIAYQSDSPNHVMVKEFLLGTSDDLQKSLMPPVLFDATGTAIISSVIM